MIKRPLYIKKIQPFVNETELVKIITGIRRSGKSVMLELIKHELAEQGVNPNAFISVNFEDFTYYYLRDAMALHDYLKAEIDQRDGRCYLFLDEIQEVENWEGAINSLRVNSDVDIYITGSNAKLLVSEFSTYLGVRYMTMQIFPLSFKEIIESRQNPTDTKKLFLDYVESGGMPLIINRDFDKASRKQYLEDLFTAVVIKDIVKRNKIRDVDMLERLIRYIIANMGKTFSANSISKFFKSEKRSISHETVLNYLKFCQEAYLLYPLERYDVPGKRMLQVDDKYYIVDHGLRETVYGNNLRDIELTLENIVAIECLRRGYSLTVGRVGEREIDFICEQGKEKIYIQVSYLMESEQTREREFGVYDSVADNFPKYVVTMDEVDFSQNGIGHMKIWDFLLMVRW